MEIIHKKKAVIYCRVSTKEQVEEGNSLVTQERQCRDYAEKQGFEIIACFVEQGESAKTADRTELKKLLSFCTSRKNNISAVIAYKIDRISRNTDDYSQIRIILKKYGVEIKSTSELFEDTPAGRFMENIIANVAQFDNDVRTERSVGGMKEAVREGRYVWMAPYGYSNVRINGKATISPNKQSAFVVKAFSEVAKGIQNIYTIRKQLIEEGMITPHGKPISKTSFYDMLRNELYIGWINKFGVRSKGGFDSIISEKQFQEVQTILNGKSKKGSIRVSDSPDFPLRRFFRHPSGKALTGCWSKGRQKKYPYYLIHGTNINIRKEVLEETFKNWLNQFFKLDIIHFEKLNELAKSFSKSEIESLGENALNLKEKLKNLKNKQDIILEKNISGIINDELCKLKIESLELEIKEIEQSLSNLPNNVKIDFTELLNITKDILLSPASVWEKASIEDKISLQWFYFPNGIEYDGKSSRTTKICNLYKAKSLISPYNSELVTHQDEKSNTMILQLPLPAENDPYTESLEFWEEIKTLASLFYNCMSDNLPFLMRA